MRILCSVAFGVATALVGASAFAQAPAGGASGDAQGGVSAGTTLPAPSGGTTEPAPPPPPPPPPPPAAAPAKAEPAPAEAAKPATEGGTDHERFVGKFAVGYHNISQIPLGQGGVGGAGRTTLNAPVIGVRYWLKERFGIDGGIGLAMATGSSETVNGTTTVTTDAPAPFGMMFHVGVPLVPAYGKHYKFLFVPEANFGFAMQNDVQTAAAGAAQPPDVRHSGSVLSLGARAGAEVHFGFIGVPELSLQASVGLLARREAWKNAQDAFNAVPERSSSAHVMGLGTTVQNDPWAIFANNISAFYYFP